MTFQGIFDVRGQVNQLAELEGAAIVGTKIKAPFSVYPEVHVLPMDNVLPTKVHHLVEHTLVDVHPPHRFFRVPVLSLPFHQTRQMTMPR
jgi:hypothetical protein